VARTTCDVSANPGKTELFAGMLLWAPLNGTPALCKPCESQIYSASKVDGTCRRTFCLMSNPSCKDRPPYLLCFSKSHCSLCLILHVHAQVHVQPPSLSTTRALSLVITSSCILPSLPGPQTSLKFSKIFNLCELVLIVLSWLFLVFQTCCLGH